MARRGPRAPDDKELALWRHVTADVEPMPGRAPPPKPPAEPVPVAPEPAASDSAARRIREGRLPLAPPAGRRDAPARPPELAAGTGTDLDARTGARLRRGQLPIDGRIDLHGLGREEAHLALRGYLRRSRELGRRCVLVITGRGRFSPEGRAVLRDALPAWLNEPDLRPIVVAFTAAQPRDGGSGAFYVLLRRVRGP